MDNLFESCCRVCLGAGADMKHVFQLDCGVRIADMITEVFGIYILSNDNFPKQICRECFEVLKVAYPLKLKCMKNDRFLQGCGDIKDEIDDMIEYEPESMPSPSSPHCDELDTVQIVYRCDKCSEVRNSKEEMKVHIKVHLRSHYKLNVKSCVCEICKMSFTTEKKLTKHKLIHDHYEWKVVNENVSYECRTENCVQVFDNYSNQLFAHIRNHAKEQNRGKGKRRICADESLVCPHCGQVYKSKQILQQHIKRHSEASDRFPCQKCPRKFKSW